MEHQNGRIFIIKTKQTMKTTYFVHYVMKYTQTHKKNIKNNVNITN